MSSSRLLIAYLITQELAGCVACVLIPAQTVFHFFRRLIVIFISISWSILMLTILLVRCLNLTGRVKSFVKQGSSY